jgi:quinolinate synthase
MSEKSVINIATKIRHQKEILNAVILAHNYQLGEVQDIADYVGDSLDLSQRAAKTDADVIVFCGVHFMAETASILCPGKKVLLPDVNAGCPMANMITADQLREKKKEHPNAVVICYINSSAEVKAESDVCCTSANAVQIVQKFAGNNEVIFIPDQYLGNYVASKTNKKMILWPGFCPTHLKIQPQDLLRLKKLYPDALLLVHPECKPEVIALADEVLSTGGMIRFAAKTLAKNIIVGTEIGLIHRLKKENPDKHFIPASEKASCPNMKKITLEKVLLCLEEMEPEIKVPEQIRTRAKISVDKMLGIMRTD